MVTPGIGGEVFNIASGRQQSVRQVAELLANAMDREDLQPRLLGRSRAGDVRHCFADITKARQRLGFEPRRSLRDSMAELVILGLGAAGARHRPARPPAARGAGARAVSGGPRTPRRRPSAWPSGSGRASTSACSPASTTSRAWRRAGFARTSHGPSITAAAARSGTDWLVPTIAGRVELLPCIHYTPPSLSRTGASSGPPRRLRDLADFVDHLLDRYGRHFPHIELWNEPNNLLDWDWRVDQDWTLFAEMVGGAAYWAKKRGWAVVLGGPCPFDLNWLDLMGQRGVLAEVSAVGIHGFPGTWDSDAGGWGGWSRHVGELRGLARPPQRQGGDLDHRGRLLDLAPRRAPSRPAASSMRSMRRPRGSTGMRWPTCRRTCRSRRGGSSTSATTTWACSTYAGGTSCWPGSCAGAAYRPCGRR